MKVLKKILIFVFGLIALALIVAAFLPKKFQSERQIVIERPHEEVFDYVKFVKNQDNFGVWQRADPDMQATEEGEDGTVGFQYRWTGKKIGKGSQTIVAITEGERIDTELDFGFGEPAHAYFITEAGNPTRTRVTWGLEGKSPYPRNLMRLFFDVGDDFEEGLRHLKEILESRPALSPDQIAATEQFRETYNNLSQEVANLSRDQLQFKPDSASWSISQCLEHIILTEKMLFDRMGEQMKVPENIERREAIQLADEDVSAGMMDRSRKLKAPENLVGTGRYDDPKEALKELATHRAKILSFIRNTPSETLRNRVLDSQFGPTDAFQSFLFLTGHTARHTLQIAEIKNHPEFPKESSE